MRDVAYGVVGALFAYGAYKLLGHAVWALAALVLYASGYIVIRSRESGRARGREPDRRS